MASKLRDGAYKQVMYNLVRDKINCIDVDRKGRSVYVKVGVVWGEEYYMGTGFSHCSPQDRFSRETGFRLALGRALWSITNQIARENINRPPQVYDRFVTPTHNGVSVVDPKDF